MPSRAVVAENAPLMRRTTILALVLIAAVAAERASVRADLPERSDRVVSYTIKARLDQDRLTLVPLSLYFKDGRAKLELGLGKGRTGVDKRQHIAARDAEREAQRDMARARRRE